MSKKLKVLMSGGGTGGHIFPAVAIAQEIKKRFPNAEFLFIGANGKMEMEKVPQAGFRIEGLNIAGFDRGNLLKNIGLPFKLISSLIKAKKIIKDEHIRSRTELQQKYGSLYNALTDQQLVNELGLPSKRANHRNWRKLTDKQLVDAANSKTKQLKIKNKTQFLKADNGLADAIIRRKLLDKIVFWKEPSSQVDLQAQ